MDCKEATRDNLIQAANKIVADVLRSGYPLAGACVVSSLPAGDFTPVSDVDILLVATDNDGKPGIFRRLVGDRVIEWVVLPNDYLRDVDRILADAGLCHDILTAIILLDEDGSLEQAQRTVAAHYHEPQWVWNRTMGQLRRVENALGAMSSHLADRNVLQAQCAHVSLLKGLYGIPRAILNKRCTMARGLLFCREATAELGWSDYMAGVLSVFGAAGVSRETITDLQDIASRIIAAAELAGTEKAIRQWFLWSSHWLLENAHPADAAWPLYFWSSSTVEQSGGERNPVVWELWQRFAAILGVARKQDLLEKNEQARRLHELALSLVQPFSGA